MTFCHLPCVYVGPGSFLTHHNSNYRSIMIRKRNLILRFKTPVNHAAFSNKAWIYCAYLSILTIAEKHFYSPHLCTTRICCTTNVSVLYLAPSAMRGRHRKPNNKFPRGGKWKQNADTLPGHICWFKIVSGCLKLSSKRLCCGLSRYFLSYWKTRKVQFDSSIFPKKPVMHERARQKPFTSVCSYR